MTSQTDTRRDGFQTLLQQHRGIVAKVAKLRADLKVPAVDDEYATGEKKRTPPPGKIMPIAALVSVQCAQIPGLLQIKYLLPRLLVFAAPMQPVNLASCDVARH